MAYSEFLDDKVPQRPTNKGEVVEKKMTLSNIFII